MESASRAAIAFALSLALTCLALGYAIAAPGPAAAGSDCSLVAGDRDNWVACVLNGMSVEDRVGQLFVVNGFGDTVDATDAKSVSSNETVYGPGITNLRDLIDRYHPGGVIYFTWSNTLVDPVQVANLSNGVQQVALQQPSALPMLISIDQEEGEVLRVGTPATVFPGSMAVGATRSLKLARRNAAITGRELRAMGINVDNAPVVDVNSNPLNTSDGIRAFGDKIGFVSRYGAASVKAYQEAVGATAKHWPGLGDTSANPDTGVTTSDQTSAQFQELNFPSFGAAFAAGVDSVMVTHIQTPNVPESPTLPTSLSPFFVNGQLRGEMGFDGVVVTDALNAVALEQYSPAEVAKLAIAAGDDQLLEIGGFPTVEPGEFVPAYEAVLEAVESGEISVARLNESVQRILELKWEVGLAGNPMTTVQAVEDEVGTPAHLRVARRTAQKSITLLRNRKNVLPLAEGTNDSVLSTGWGSTSTGLIADEIASRGLTAQALPTGTDPTADKVASVVKAARGFDYVVVNTFNAWAPGSEGQLALVRALRKTKTPVIVLAVGTPYDIAYFPRVQAFVAAYDYQHVSINAAIAAIFGTYSPTGKLPVTITNPVKPDKVVYPFGAGKGY